MIRLFYNWDRHKIGKRLHLEWPERFGPELPVGSIRTSIQTRYRCKIVVTSTDIFVISAQDIDEAIEEYNLPIYKTFYTDIIEHNIKG